jgi:hypothetical protein
MKSNSTKWTQVQSKSIIPNSAPSADSSGPYIMPPYAPESQQVQSENPVTDRGQVRDASSQSRKVKPENYDAHTFYPVNTEEMARTQRNRLVKSVEAYHPIDRRVPEFQLAFDANIKAPETAFAINGQNSTMLTSHLAATNSDLLSLQREDSFDYIGLSALVAILAILVIVRRRWFRSVDNNAQYDTVRQETGQPVFLDDVVVPCLVDSQTSPESPSAMACESVEAVATGEAPPSYEVRRI